MFPAKERYEWEKWKYKFYYKLLRLWSIVTLFKNHLLWLFDLLKLYPSDLEEICINTRKDKFSLNHWKDLPQRSMATLRNKRKLAAVSRKTPESSRSSRGKNVLDPELTQDYISQVSEEIEGRVTKKLSKEFSKTESHILGALSELDELLLNPENRTCSVAVQGTSRNANSENRESHGDHSSDDPYPEVGYFLHQSGQLNSPETETNSHMVTENYPHNVTRATEEFRQHPHMMTATQEIAHCSPTTSSGKQKKARSTSQPQFRSDNTPATIEADQILLALQHLATNSNSANFNNSISRISKLPLSLTTTTPTFDGKSEKFELFEDLFQTSLKIHNQLTQEDKINYFHALMRGDALQTFKNITSPNRENLGEILTVFRRKDVKPQSMATAKKQISTTGLQPRKPEVNWFSRWTPEIGERRIRSCSSSNHRAIHLCQNAPSPREINQPGAFGKLHVWTDYVASWKGVRTGWLGSPRRNAHKHCDATSPTAKL